MNKKGITFGNFFDIFILAIVFVLSMIISPIYVEGDQEIYIDVYQEISSLPLATSFLFYTYYMTSMEIFHFLYIYFVSQLIEKDIAMSIVNCLIAFLASRIFRKAGLNYFLIFIVVVTSYYSLVLYFAAERLKFGFLFFLLGLNIGLNRLSGKSIIFLSIFGHLQMFFYLLGLAILLTFKNFKQMVKKSTLSVWFLISIFGSFLFLALLIQVGIVSIVIEKLRFYIANADFIDTVILLFLGTATLLLSEKKDTKLIACLFISFLLGSFLIGGDRLNMMAYFVTIYFLGKNVRALIFLIFPLSVYTLIKSVIFVNNILSHGHGFSII